MLLMKLGKNDRSSAKKNMLWILLLIAVFIGVTVFHSTNSVGLSFEEHTFSVAGPQDFKYSVAFQNIQSLAIVEEFDRGKMISGSTANKICAGKWESDSYGEYQLCIATQTDVYIVLEPREGEILIFNCESRDITEQIYAAFTEMLIEDGYLQQ